MRNIIVLSSLAAAASLQANTIAWWRFEAGPADANVQKNAAAGSTFDPTIPDDSGNGNALSVWETGGGGAGFVFRGNTTNTPLPSAPLVPNLYCVENTGDVPGMFTQTGGALQTWEPAAFTVEVSLKPETKDQYRTYVGRDSQGGLSNNDNGPAAMYFQITPDDRIAFKFLDKAGNFQQAVSIPHVMKGWVYPTGSPNDVPWQNLAAVSDGTTLSVWLNNGNGFYKVATTTLVPGNTIFSQGQGSGGDWVHGNFTVGRGLFNGGHTDRGYGLIDEVRLSDAALTPAQFLFGTPGVTPVVLKTLPVSGWNQDIIINNATGAPPYNSTITGTIDNGGGTTAGGTFIASGNYPVGAAGTPTDIVGLTNAVYTSATGSGATFQFQDFTSSNAILMKGGQSGTLTLTTPSSMTTLALYGTTGNGPSAANVTVNFTDGSNSVYPIAAGVGITSDWFNNGSNPIALQVGNRETIDTVDTNLTYDINEIISIYESKIVLNTTDQAKLVKSVTVTNTADPTTSGSTLAIMAIDSDAVTAAPSTLKITNSVFNFTNSTVALTFNSTTGTNYRVTRSATLNGTDWTVVTGTTTTVNSTTSTTITAPFTKGTKDFFRVEVAP